MPHENMSIQSFFPPQRSPAKQQTSSPSPGDGFTSTELNEALNPPVLEDWDPPREYTDTDIAELLPGPGRISFRGRIVGLWDVNAVHKMPRSARGYVKLIIRDDTGAITVRLSSSTVSTRLTMVYRSDFGTADISSLSVLVNWLLSGQPISQLADKRA